MDTGSPKIKVKDVSRVQGNIKKTMKIGGQKEKITFCLAKEDFQLRNEISNNRSRKRIEGNCSFRSILWTLLWGSKD